MKGTGPARSWLRTRQPYQKDSPFATRHVMRWDPSIRTVTRRLHTWIARRRMLV